LECEAHRPPPRHDDAEDGADHDGEREAGGDAVKRSGPVRHEVAVAHEVDPGDDHVRGRRQGEGRAESEPRRRFPRQRAQEDGEIAEQCLFHIPYPDARYARVHPPPSGEGRDAFIASTRTRSQISSTLSTNILVLKQCGSVLSKRVSMIALICPGRADITATRSDK